MYLFGSRVEGFVGPLSDYDFAVLTDQPSSRHVRAILASFLAHVLDTERIDVVLLNHTATEMGYSVISQGELLYQRDVSTRIEYEARVMGLYGDYLPVLRAQQCDILKGGGHDTRVQRYRTAFGRTERTLGKIRTAENEIAR